MLNFQNLKRGGVLRKAICAPEGHVLIPSDFSQIELRLTLWLGGEHDAVKKLAAGGDLYSELASQLYGVEVTKELAKKDRHYEEMRHVGKSAVLGAGFGMGAAKFQIYCAASGVKIDPDRAKAAIKLFRNTYSGVPQLWKIMEEAYLELLKIGCNADDCNYTFSIEVGGCGVDFGFDPLFGSPGIKLPSGLWLKYPNLKIEDEQWSYGMENETKVFGGYFLENLVQALARCILTEKTLELNAHWPVVMSTHDEPVMLVSAEQEKEAIKQINDIMIKPINWLPDLPIACETKAAIRYGDAK